MLPWEQALEKFIAKEKNKPWCEGIILFGSYATGNQNSMSDIDVYILSDDNQNWRERGNTKIDNFIIEYFINPLKQTRAYFEDDLKKNNFITENMIGFGKILFDKNGMAKKIQQEALSYRKHTISKLNDFQHKSGLYSLWDKMDELQSLYQNNLETRFFYNITLKELIDFYFSFNQIPSITPSKIEQILTDKNYQSRYNINKIPPTEFIDIFIRAMKEQTLENITALYEYVSKDAGGFDISNFSLKSNITI